MLDKIYFQYANDVIDGKIAACEAIRLAAKRMIDWLDRTDIYFDYDNVDYLIRWVYKMKHTKAPYTGQPFELLPWQQFVLANIYGWKYTETNLRVTTNVFIMISRKAGKTALASAFALIAAIADKEIGAEVELVANSKEQASIAFEACDNFAESLDRSRKKIIKTKRLLTIPSLKSKIQVLCSDDATLDGYNASCFILDEFHAAKTWNLYNVMKSSQGMRAQPLAIVITTAGFLLAGYPCYDYRQTCIDILRGKKQDDSTFSAIYELDPEDDWKDESNWEKCQPSLNQTVSKKYLAEQVTSAINQPSMEVGVKTKNFNIFCQSSTTWIPDDIFYSTMHKVDLQDFENETCYIGVDLSAVSDMTSTAVLFPPNSYRKAYPDKFVFKNFIYLPENTIRKSINGNLYKQWSRNKHLILTSGNVVDYDEILKNQIAIYNKTDVVNIAYDSWNATQWAINATNKGLPLQPFSQAIGNFNRPTKEFERLMLQNKLIIDTNPVVRWCAANCELKIDPNNGNCKPIKSGGDKNKKIDPIIAMIQALGSYLLDGEELE